MNVSILVRVPHDKRATVIETSPSGDQVQRLDVEPNDQVLLYVVDGNSLMVSEAEETGA